MSPQAAPELRAKFPGCDQEAMVVIERNFVWDRPKLWIIRKRDPSYQMTDREWDAICYLCDEWDWGYEE